MLKQLQNQRWFLFLTAIFFTVLFIRHAWVAEDAYITFRTIDNAVHGFGLRWNVAERVQVYTHPLWLMLITPLYALFGNIYFLVLALSYLLSTPSFLLVVRKNGLDDAWKAIFIVIAFMGSKSFMDYTSSGLENPLSFLLIYGMLSTFFRDDLSRSRQLLYLCLFTSLAALNRQDLVLMGLPMIAYEAWCSRRILNYKQVMQNVALGFLPLILWLIFSVVYYGFPFPNTYYAKLHTGIPKLELMQQGLAYYVDSHGRDPITLHVIFITLAVAVSQTRQLVAALGVILYLAYIINIGGDFMSGRFFSVPLFACLTIFAHTRLQPKFSTNLMYVVMLLAMYCGASPSSPFASGKYFHDTLIPTSGVADERGWYFKEMGLLQFNIGQPFPRHGWRDLGERWKHEGATLVQFSNIGIAGYYAGPQVHIVDGYALTDPFLSRRPTIRMADGRWRIGHFFREIPPAYMESLQKGSNTFTDPELAAYYDDIQLVTRGSLFSLERWKAIKRLNL